MDAENHATDRCSGDPGPACFRRVSSGAVVLGVIIAVVFAGSAWLRGRLVSNEDVPAPPTECRRIVSLAPSVTETLFQLGLGDRVVGVSRYCKFPPEACDLPRVGGFFDPNMEAILALEPDLVIFPTPGAESLQGFKKLGLSTLVLDHRDPEGLFDSITVIGRACGVEQDAAALADELRARLHRVTEKTAGLPRPRVLLAMDHSSTGGRIEDVYVAGSSRYFNPIIRWAGGQNVFEDVGEASPVVSREAILKTNPEVIIDLASLAEVPGRNAAACLESWRRLEQIDAVKNDRVYLVTENYARVPGPRFILLVEHLARVLHPEVGWADE